MDRVGGELWVPLTLDVSLISQLCVLDPMQTLQQAMSAWGPIADRCRATATRYRLCWGLETVDSTKAHSKPRQVTEDWRAYPQ